MKRTGIYIIKSSIKPERYYVGSAVNISQRWSDHISRAKANKHRSPMLQNHINKYGIEDLEFSILEECSIEELLKREQYYLDELKPFFNTLKIAGSPIGHKHSEYTKSIMNISKIGTHCSDERKRKIGDANRGRKHTQETKNKMSELKKGHKYYGCGEMTEERIEKYRTAMIGNNYGKKLKGIKRSEETKRKISESRKKLFEMKKINKTA